MGVIGRGLVLGGRYRLIRRLRSERSGDVWEADDRLWQRVSLTLIAPDLSEDELFLERLRRDVRLSAWPFLSHPNIARIFLHRAEAGIDYVVTEPLNGQTMADRLENGPISREVATRTAALAADALDAAHTSGIVHGALRPDRLLFSPSEGLKLIGFAVDHAAAVSDLARGNVETWESPYLAPEQRRDGAARPASDIYALARVLVEMLTHVPSERGTDAAGSDETHRRDGEPAMKLPSEVALLIDDAMSPNEASRPSAKRFAARLRHPAAQPSVSQPFVSPWKAVQGRGEQPKDQPGRPPIGTSWNPFSHDDQALRTRPAKVSGSGLQPLGQLFGGPATENGPDSIGPSAVGWTISERDVWARRAGASAPSPPEKQQRPVFGLHWRSRSVEARTASSAPPRAPAEPEPPRAVPEATPEVLPPLRPEPKPPTVDRPEVREVAASIAPSPPPEQALPAASGPPAPSPTVFEALMRAKRRVPEKAAVVQKQELPADRPVPLVTAAKVKTDSVRHLRSIRRLAIPASLALIILVGWGILSRDAGGPNVLSTSAPSRAGSSVPSAASQPDPVPAGSITVPDVVGLGTLDAREALEEAGLVVTEAVPVSGTPGLVIGTRPGVDAPVEPGTPITLLVGAPPDRLDED
jgi:serine/threonine protein kinase